MAGLTGVFGYAGYSASKFAVVGFSEALRRELRPHGVHVARGAVPAEHPDARLRRGEQTKPAEVLAAEEKVKTLEPEQVAGLPAQGAALEDRTWSSRASTAGSATR